jgi:dipeptide/tripeptide permease
VLAAVNGAGDLLSSAAVGWIWAGFGPAAAFGFAAVLMSAGTVLLVLTRER